MDKKLEKYISIIRKQFFNSSDNVVILDDHVGDEIFNSFIALRRDCDNIGETIPIKIAINDWIYYISPQQEKNVVKLIRTPIKETQNEI